MLDGWLFSHGCSRQQDVGLGQFSQILGGKEGSANTVAVTLGWNFG
jgi:hypothetical protein